jgi:hypothetical protein
MIHHVHSTLLSEANTPATGPNANASSGRSAGESFEGVLSDAVGPVRAASTAHQAAKLSEELSGRSLVRGPINPDKLVRPPEQTPAQSTSVSAGSSHTDPLQASNSGPFTSLPIPAPSSVASANPTSQSSTPTVDAQQAFDNAYWASQPAAVQALRTIPDAGQRATLATQLASQGYSIDMPIMVWGWDPSIVTSMRQAEGYTWVPSALQNPVEMLPGLPSMGTMAAYNANNPPSGSIAV